MTDTITIAIDELAKRDAEIWHLRTEVLRLRAALHTIAGTSKFKPPPVDEMVDIARVALNDEGRDVAKSVLERDRL